MAALIRTPWRGGPCSREDAPVFVSFTAFSPHRLRDWPGIARAGLSLRSAWPSMEGAVGLWLWATSSLIDGGSVSVWESEAALKGFVRWPPHVQIMRRFRTRGSLRTASLQTESFDPEAVWRWAVAARSAAASSLSSP